MMSNQVRIAAIELGLGSDTDHKGASVNIFFSGCSRSPKCIGCHNPMLWDKQEGTLMNIGDILNEIHHYTTAKYVVFTGGEPLDQSEGLRELAWSIHRHTDKKLWLFTGNKLEDIPADISAPMDTIVAGPYDYTRKQKDRYPATENQIMIHLTRERKNC